MTDLQERLRGTLTAVAATTDVSYPPALDLDAHPSRTRRLRRGRRLALAVVGGLLATAGGLGVAQAAGVLPDGLARAFPGDHGGVDPQVDPTTAVRVVSAPGPGGHRFVVWVAAWRKGGRCVAMLFEPSTSAGRPTVGDFTAPSAGCAVERAPAFSSAGGPIGDYTVFAFDARGRVARAVVRLADGTELPAAVQHGWVAGWFPAPGAAAGDFRSAAAAQLVGYATDGRVVLRTHVQPPAAN